MSESKESLGIMYFRRDLRLEDNTALNKCISENDYILPLFIFDTAQIEEKKNKYYNDPALTLLRHFLSELNDQFMTEFKTNVPITVDEGDTIKILEEISHYTKKFNTTIYFNMDFTPFALQRDTNIFLKMTALGIAVKAYRDHLLVNLESSTELTNYTQLYAINNKDVYKKFTPFYNYYSANPPPAPHTVNFKKIKQYVLDGFKSSGIHTDTYMKDYNRANAIKSLKPNDKYHETHNMMYDEKGTYRLSHYLKFGVISIREAYHALSKVSSAKARVAVIRQLYWRDFYTLIAWANPKLLGWHFDGFDSKKIPKWKKLAENSAIYDKYNEIKWNYNKKIIDAWQLGKTGFPIVDAGMRQLLHTGYMHNRARLITASFLTKICGVDWRIGERWFAQHLIDYDPIINNGNWLWVAGGGADSQPYFRVFNPWLQQKEYDPDCIYIKRWVPELVNVDNKIIHKYYEHAKIENYVSPIIDYSVEKENTYKLYKKVL
jgi:deoxyribodipyrimidine photo-lyase